MHKVTSCIKNLNLSIAQVPRSQVELEAIAEWNDDVRRNELTTEDNEKLISPIIFTAIVYNLFFEKLSRKNAEESKRCGRGNSIDHRSKSMDDESSLNKSRLEPSPWFRPSINSK